MIFHSRLPLQRLNSRFIETIIKMNIFRLREICPNLYGAADLKTTKANELLQSAKHQTNKTEQTAMLHKSLELFK